MNNEALMVMTSAVWVRRAPASITPCAQGRPTRRGASCARPSSSTSPRRHPPGLSNSHGPLEPEAERLRAVVGSSLSKLSRRKTWA